MNEIDEVQLVVYGVPVPKARPRVVNGHAFTPDKTKKQEEKIGLVYKSKYGQFRFEEGVPLRIVVGVYLPVPKSTSKKKRDAMVRGEILPVGHVGDVDNYTKLVMDALLQLAYKDDCQIVDLSGSKRWGIEPRTEIYIARLDYDQ